MKPSLVLPPDGTVDVRSDGHTVFVLAPSVVAAYEVPGGRQRWAVPVTGVAQLVAAERGRVVIAEAEPATLTALNAATGAPVWQVGGYAPVLHGTAGADGVVVADLRGTRADRPDLAGIDIRTGTVRWTLPAPPGPSTRSAPMRPTCASQSPSSTPKGYCECIAPTPARSCGPSRLSGPGRSTASTLPRSGC
ncbi:PQQ-binding-like beta-propeller repeat protein [Micromonospora sp. NPDC005553]|uniref:outer membrane protein assembly factor BamB family protein n=1 Tax=Micromonospora sp. NPDC005553 TaxID=3364232 RepID=UPI0036BB473F